jgi:4-oxalocrotonate tautomerase
LADPVGSAAAVSGAEGGYMPHVVVKLAPGKSEEQKFRLAEDIANEIVRVLNYEEEAVSVAFEEVERQDWAERVYKSEIQDKWDTVYRKPGYNPFEK